MFGRKFKIFTLFGFKVHIDLSWILLALLVAWTLAAGVFPQMDQNLPRSTYWIMGILGAVGLFLSIVFHEFFHSLVARRLGLPMEGITLFIFGGVAEMNQEPETPRTELLMAIAGPISSVVLGVAFLVASAVAGATSVMAPLTMVLGYLGMMNLILAVFNMIPAFPLDGGRVLRSVLWWWKGNLRWSTRISAQVGSGFGMALILLGVINVLVGSFIGGMWWFLIGMFVRAAASQSYQQLTIRQAMEGEPLRRFVNPDPVTVGSATRIDELVEDYVYRYHYKMFPVMDDGELRGCVTLQQVKDVPQEEWHDRRVADLMEACSSENTIDADEDSMKALSKMSRVGASRLIVTENGGTLAGVISLKDMLGFLSLKIELEDGASEIPSRYTSQLPEEPRS